LYKTTGVYNIFKLLYVEKEYNEMEERSFLWIWKKHCREASERARGSGGRGGEESEWAML